MSHRDFATDKLSQRLPSLLPEYVRDEAPIFEQFLKAYFEFLEAEIIVLSTQGDLDNFVTEDGDNLVLETAVNDPSPQEDSSKIIAELTADTQFPNDGTISPRSDYAEPFKKGEYIYGHKGGSIAKIKIIHGNTLYCDVVSGNGFRKDEVIEGRASGQYGKIKSFKENSILANNRLLEYSDIDHTLDSFLEYYQKDFIPSLDLRDIQNTRLTIKNIGDFYQQKGTEESLKFILRVILGLDAEVRYPINETIHASDSDHTQDRRLAVALDNIFRLPKGTDKITQYNIDEPTKVDAEAIVESVYVLDAGQGHYSLTITQNHFGTFEPDRAVTFLDRDGKTQYTGVVKGILKDIDLTGSSTGIQLEEEGDSILLESGLAADYSGVFGDITLNEEPTNGGKVLLDTQNAGAMYSKNDKVFFKGASNNSDSTKAETIVDFISRGEVQEVIIEDAGTNYEAGDIIIFDNSNTGGSGAEAVIGALEDVVVLENATHYGQFEYTATAGQTQFGNGVRDNNGRRLFFDDSAIRVFVNGLEQTHYDDFTFKNSVVDFTTGLNAGDVVEIYTDFNHLLYEDGDRIQYHTTVSSIKQVKITSGGYGYENLPLVYPGGYIYFAEASSVNAFSVGEVVTGNNDSGITAQVHKLDPDNKRIIVKRRTSDTGVFTSGHVIRGLTSGAEETSTNVNVSSGTGAKLKAFSENIGSVTGINIQTQGFNFTSSPQVDSEKSFFNMLIDTPSANLIKDQVFTGRITGSTAKVVSHDENRGILTFTDLNGNFVDNEEVLFNNTDTFKIFKFRPYSARGIKAGEGIINPNLLGTKSTPSAADSNLHDNYLYQLHSYVIRVGESINKYRSIIKELVHPAGHIFFGEVAIKNNINAPVPAAVTFVPTIIINAFPSYDILHEESTRDSEVALLMEDGYKIKGEEAPDMNSTAFTEYLKTVCIYKDIDILVAEVSRADFDTVKKSHANFGHLNILTTSTLVNASVHEPFRTEQRVKKSVRAMTVANNGTRNVYYYNGEETPRLELRQGYTYYFTHPTSHPFRFSETSDGTHGAGGSTEYTTGVTKYSGVTILNVTASTPNTLYYYCDNHTLMGGEAYKITENMGTVLALDWTNRGDYERKEDHTEHKRRRISTDGKVYVSQTPHQEQRLIFEDGSFIKEEDERFYLREDAGNETGFGSYITFEDGDRMELDGYFVEGDMFVTEQSAQLDGHYLQTEIDGDVIVLEDGSYLAQEDSSENSIISYEPLGLTLRSLNIINNQSTYNISYYLLDEDVSDDAEEDHIVLENGYGDILLEDGVQSEGIRISDLSAFHSDYTIGDFDRYQRKRSNIGFSSYIKSSKITNSTLSSL